MEEENRMRTYSILFGSHLPMKLTIEREALGRCGRMPGERSSMLGLDVSMNNLNRIEETDYMNRNPNTLNSFPINKQKISKKQWTYQEKEKQTFIDFSSMTNWISANSNLKHNGKR